MIQSLAPLTGLRDLFPDPPRSTRTFPGSAARYVKTPTSSLDWMGAGWESPVSLDFETTTMAAQRYGQAHTYVHERPVHPVELIQDLSWMWQELSAALNRGGYVVDAAEHVGVQIDGDTARDEGYDSVRVKCWPAIEGVTTPRKDTTL